MRYRTTIIRFAFVFIAVAALWIARAFAAASPASAGDIHMQQPLAGRTGTDVTILTVDYPPGGSTPPHEHPGTTYAYVLQGSVVSQVDHWRDSNVHFGTDVERAAARSSHDLEERELNGTGETTGLHDRTARRTTDDLPALANVYTSPS